MKQRKLTPHQQRLAEIAERDRMFAAMFARQPRATPTAKPGDGETCGALFYDDAQTIKVFGSGGGALDERWNG